MNSLFLYLLELNLVLMVLFTAYKLFFEKDSNFLVRRIYLMIVILLPLIIPFLPSSLRLPVEQLPVLSIQLEGITVNASGQSASGTSAFTLMNGILLLYLIVLGLGILKLLYQLFRISLAALTSRRTIFQGQEVRVHPLYHASSLFGIIFMDPEQVDEENAEHILDHENIHSREGHSVDRILTELFVIINWFNPVAWLFRRAVIRNLEYLADSAVLQKGTDPTLYQLSILNQYMGSASITNQFSSQIKNRIKMLNRNYKMGSGWKLTLLIPITVLAVFFVSCTEKESNLPQAEEEQLLLDEADDQTFFVVEEMPTFNGGDPKEFRKFIAQNVKYPKEAAKNGAMGKIFIKFVVDKEGKVVVPDQESLAKIEGKPLDEVVVVTYRTLDPDQKAPAEEYIQMLKDEAIRVVESSPNWTPGKQRGKNVKVMYTFPINFSLK